MVWLSSLALFLGLLGLQIVGCRMGARRLERDPSAARVGPIEGAIFALLGLLIAFTFSGASARFDTRRLQIVDESNAVGTAWLRLALLPEPAQARLRPLFRDYLDARIAGHESLPDLEAAAEGFARATELQGEIWSSAVEAVAQGDGASPMLVLPALNQMFDIASARVAALRIHTSSVVYALLVLLSLCCAFLAGYAIAKARAPSWTYMLAFAGVLTLTVYVIVDLEFPRVGLIQLDTDHVLRDLRRSFEPR
jgi:hypothetical protein